MKVCTLTWLSDVKNFLQMEHHGRPCVACFLCKSVGVVVAVSEVSLSHSGFMFSDSFIFNLKLFNQQMFRCFMFIIMLHLFTRIFQTSKQYRSL